MTGIALGEVPCRNQVLEASSQCRMQEKGTFCTFQCSASAQEPQVRPAVTCKVTAESAPPFLVAGVQRQAPLLSDRAENSSSVSSNSHQAALGAWQQFVCSRFCVGSTAARTGATVGYAVHRTLILTNLAGKSAAEHY